jgi:signal transduction histidine kinase
MEALGTLAGGTHDFNNILTAILGFTELSLFDVPQDGRAWNNMREVLAAGRRARDLVHQILAFSRQHPSTQQPVDLHPLVSELMTWLRATLPSTIDIRQHLDQDTGLVLADPTQLHQILLNLCTNAEYAMRETGGVLVVRLETVEVREDFAALTRVVRRVRHGARQAMASSWDPGADLRSFLPGYWRRHGHGLAVVHGIVASHGGAIATSTPPWHGV